MNQVIGSWICIEWLTPEDFHVLIWCIIIRGVLIDYKQQNENECSRVTSHPSLLLQEKYKELGTINYK